MKFAVLVLGLGACSIGAPKDPSAPKLFADRCASCHGTNGTGASAPALTQPLKHGNDLASVSKVIKHGIPDTLMPPSGLPDTLNRGLAQYVLSLRKTKPRK